MAFTRKDTKVAKAVAVVWMCIHHLFAFPDRFPENVSYISIFPHDYEYVLGYVGKICVAMFVCLSGYGTYKSICAKEEVGHQVLSKIWGLYKKYWSVFFIFIPIGMLIGVERIEKNIVSFIYNFTALKPSYNGEWWFLPPFIVLCIIAPMLVRWINKKRSSPAMDFLAVMILSLASRKIVPKVLDLEIMNGFRTVLFGQVLESTVYFIPVFLMGCVIAKHGLFDWYLSAFNKWYTALPISSVVMIVTVYMRYKIGGETGIIFMRRCLLFPLFHFSGLFHRSIGWHRKWGVFQRRYG